MRIALVAGEASGDILGAGLIHALKQRYPAARFEGIGGPLMVAQGMNTLYPMERLSVMGLVEVLGRLPELLKIRRSLKARWSDDPPDLFVGIDAPDFNLPLERQLKQRGIPTCHYVSPSVWAWREGRARKIAQSTDLMLCLLPFEKAFYDRHGIEARFIGHTLADEIPLQVDGAEARRALGIDPDSRWVALLPGSRGGEVDKLGPLFIQAARWMLERQPELKFLIPAANAQRYRQLKAMLAEEQLSATLVEGQSRRVMAASDALLLASGTAALEGMLLRRPMVVAYRMAPLTHAIISRLLKVPYVSLPNLLADEPLVPELIQQQATPEALGRALLEQMDESPRRQAVLDRFDQLHRQLRLDASRQAAEAVLGLLIKGGS